MTPEQQAVENIIGMAQVTFNLWADTVRIAAGCVQNGAGDAQPIEQAQTTEAAPEGE